MAINLGTPTIRRRLKSCCLLDLYREKNRNGDTAEDLIRADDKLLREVFKRHKNEQSMKQSVRADDFADGGCFIDWLSFYVHVGLSLSR
jgi:hypothetical protein